MTVLAITLSPSTAETIRWGTALLIPLAVGLLTKSTASAGLKSVVMVVLSAAQTAVTAVLQSRGHNLDAVFRDFIQTTVIAVAMYHGVWRPTNIAAAVNQATPNFGLGSPPELEVDTGVPAPADAVALPSPEVAELADRVTKVERAHDRLSRRVGKISPAKASKG